MGESHVCLDKTNSYFLRTHSERSRIHWNDCAAGAETEKYIVEHVRFGAVCMRREERGNRNDKKINNFFDGQHCTMKR